MAAGRPLPIEPEKEMIIMAIHDHSLELAGKPAPCPVRAERRRDGETHALLSLHCESTRRRSPLSTISG